MVAGPPYSASQLPDRDRLRITVKELGDHSATLARLAPGTRVAIEGPYGAFTTEDRPRRPVLAITAGVGSTPGRALLEDLPSDSTPIVLARGTTADAIPLAHEIEALIHQRGGTFHRLIGPREDVQPDAATLRGFAPDIRQRDVFVCGPGGFTKQVLAAARAAGVPRGQLHHETFDY